MTAAPSPEGHDSERFCGGETRSGTPCRRPAGWGTDHPGRGCCKLHLGSTRAHKSKARREAAVEAVAHYGLPRDVDPHEALLEEVRRTAGHVAMLERVVGELEREKMVRGVTKAVELPDGGRRVTVEAAFNVWLTLYHAERKHLLDACRTAIACGVAERQVRLEEEKGRLIADVFRAVFADPALGLTEAKRKTALAAAARHLRAIPGGKAA